LSRAHVAVDLRDSHCGRVRVRSRTRERAGGRMVDRFRLAFGELGVSQGRLCVVGATTTTRVWRQGRFRSLTEEKGGGEERKEKEERDEIRMCEAQG